MKTLLFVKIALVSLLLSGFALSASAQSASDIFNSDAKIVWTGVDFTKVKVVGETGTVSPIEMLSLFDKINEVIISEPKKYNFTEALTKKTVEFDLSGVTKANSKINADDLISMSSTVDESAVTEAYIAQSVKSYALDTKEGIGLSIFMKVLDKPKVSASMILAFYDIKTRKVLFTESMSGKAQGFGFRNYWAYSVYDVLRQIKLTQYKSWKSKYGK
jgi:hypothetical protein